MLTVRLMGRYEDGSTQSLPISWDLNALQIDGIPLGLNDWLQMLKRKKKIRSYYHFIYWIDICPRSHQT